jgi:hypothetical protein
MSPELIQLGQQALSAVASGVAMGAPLVKCQLLASQLYEALRNGLRESPQAGEIRRNMLIAAVIESDGAGSRPQKGVSNPYRFLRTISLRRCLSSGAWRSSALRTWARSIPFGVFPSSTASYMRLSRSKSCSSR